MMGRDAARFLVVRAGCTAVRHKSSPRGSTGHTSVETLPVSEGTCTHTSKPRLQNVVQNSNPASFGLSGFEENILITESRRSLPAEDMQFC